MDDAAEVIREAVRTAYAARRPQQEIALERLTGTRSLTREPLIAPCDVIQLVTYEDRPPGARAACRDRTVPASDG
jgi:hypothetical protein